MGGGSFMGGGSEFSNILTTEDDEMKDDEMKDDEMKDRVLNLKFKLDRLRAEIGVAAWAVVLLWAVVVFLIFYW